MELEKIKERFTAFSESECKDNLELYYKLSNEVANGEGLLKSLIIRDLDSQHQNRFLFFIS